MRKLSIDQGLFVMAFECDADYDVEWSLNAYLDLDTGTVEWVYDEDEDAEMYGLGAADNRTQRERVETEPDRFLLIPGLSHSEHHEILQEFLASDWIDDEDFVARAIERVWDPARPRPEPPRTPWGDPSLEGHWSFAAYMPLERPEELAGKPLYTPEEAIEAFQRAVLADAAIDPATVHYDWTEFGLDNWQSPIRPNRRTSMIVDPPDGRLPALTPEGLERFQAQRPRHTLESRGLAERCILGNDGPPNVPFTQNTGQSQIFQTRDHVVLILEENSDVRIVPLDGSPHAPEIVRHWLGDSRGHWDGNTLVVETTNFHEKRKWEGSAGNMHLVERFSRVADDTLLYEVTVTDPTTWEAPWSIEVPLPMMDPPGIFEFACHEQNYGIINVVRGARARAAEYEAELPR